MKSCEQSEQSTNNRGRTIWLQNNGRGHNRPDPRLSQDKSSFVFEYHIHTEMPNDEEAAHGVSCACSNF